MPDQKISDLGDGGLPLPTDDFVVARGTTNNKLAWSSLSAAATAGNIAVTLSGNTAGALALVSSGTLTLAGGNNITLSQAGNAVTISGANAGGAQTGISGIANSETTYTSGTVSLSELGAITIRSTTGQQFQFSVPNTSSLSATGIVSISTNGSTISIGASQSVQPETQTFIAGISASDTLYTSGSVRFTGSQAVTVRSGTGQLVVIDAPLQSVQPETQTFIGGISASDTVYTSGTVRFTGVGGGITVSTNTGQRIDLSVAAQSVQPETQTFVGGIGNSQTTYTSGTVNLSVVAGNLTIRSTTGQAFQFSMSQTVQAETQTAISGIANSQTTYTSGTVSLSELGAITIRSTTGNQYQFSVNSQTVQTQGILSAGVSTGGNTVGNTTVNTGSRFVIVASGNATASQATAAGASTITISVGTQTVQTQGVLSIGASTGGNTAGNTTVNTGSRLVFVGSNNITVSQGTAAGATTLTISGPATSAQQTGISAIYDGANSISSGTVRVTDANGVTFSVNGNTLSASVNQSLSMFAVSNTTQSTSGTAHKSALSFGGAGIASVGVTGGSVVISVPSGGGAGYSAGVSNLGNTAGSTGVTGTRLVLAGTNMVSLSQSTDANGGTVSINATQSVQTQGILSMGVSTGGATSGDTTVNTGSRMVLVGTNATLSQGTAAGASTITISVPATSSLSGVSGIFISTNGSTISVGVNEGLYDWQNMPLGDATLLTHISGISKVPFYWNDDIPGTIKALGFAFRGSMVTASQPLSLSVHLGIYTFVNSTSAARVGSVSEAFVVSSASSVSFSGIRNLVISAIGTHTALSTLSAGEYMFGMMFSATATNAMNMSLMGANSAGGPLGLIYPGTNQLSTGTSQGVQAMYGRGSTTVNAMPANVVASELVNQGQGASMQLHPWIYIRS